MSEKTDDDLPSLKLSPPVGGVGLGLEETSQGATDMTEGVAEQAGGIPMPSQAELQLGRSLHLDSELVLEVEHLFGSSALFSGLSREEIRELVNLTEKRPVQAGELLFEQGEEAASLYIIQSGEVQVRATSPSGEEILLAVLGASTVVGELALLGGGARSATVEALSDCDIYQLKRDEFERLRHAMSPAAYKVILNITRTVETRRRQAERRIAEVFDDPAQHIELFASQVHDMLARIKKA